MGTLACNRGNFTTFALFLIYASVAVLVSFLIFQNVAYASDDDPYCEYKSVDVVYTFNSTEECYVSTTAVVEMTNVKCWSVNYSLDSTFTSELKSISAKDQIGNFITFEPEDNGALFSEGGVPEVNKCAIDEDAKKVYVNAATFDRSNSGASDFSGEITITWSTRLTDFPSVESSNGEFLFKPFATDRNSKVTQLNVEFNSLKYLGFKDIYMYPWGDVMHSFSGTAKPAYTIRDVEFDDVSASFTGGLYTSSTNKAILSTHDLGWFVCPEYFIVNSLLILDTLSFLIMVAILAYIWTRTKTISPPKDIYFRDIPKVKNPVQSVIRAMSYRNPNVKNLEDAVREKDLIAYILLSNEREGKIEFLDENTIKLHWSKLTSTEKRVYNRLSCNYMCEQLGLLKSPLEMQGEDFAIIHLNVIKELPSVAKTGSSNVSSEKSMDVMKCYSSHLGSEFFASWQAYNKDSNEAKKRSERLWIVLGIFMSFIATVFLAGVFDQIPLFTVLWLIFVNVFVSAVKLSVFVKERHERVSKEVLQEIEQIYGLKNWIRDYTNLKEAKPSAGIVWGEFLEWSYLLGESERGLAILKDCGDSPSSVLENTKLNVYFSTAYTMTVSSVVALLDVAGEIGRAVSKSVHESKSE